MRPAVAIGNLPPGMNKWRIAVVVVVVALAIWPVLRSCAPQEEPAVVVPPPSREQFHTSKPLQLALVGAADSTANEWLERELHYLLIRGRMRVAGANQSNVFTLRVELPQAPQTKARLALLAPDGQVERETEVDLGTQESGKLATVQSFARALPRFLGAENVATDWTSFIGTADRATYDTLIRSSDELLGTSGHGFTQVSAPDHSPAVERLESLVRKQRSFARAVALLSVGYLSLGGEDEASLTRIAEATAERALGIDPTLADARSALGLVRLRRGEWAGALEHFDAALAIDANSTPALEGLACLLIDVGHASAALPIAQRAVALQPANVGANECLAYAQLATDSQAPAEAEKPANDSLAAAQAKAMNALLSGDIDLAQRTLHGAKGARNAATWVEPLLQAAASRQKTSQALQAITRATSDRLIDPVTEVVSGAALRQSDFVFNRMLRLHRQNEPVPLRILWLPRTDFLRQHVRFAEIVEAEALLPFWQDHGSPDLCADEPAVYGCKLRAAGTTRKSE